MRFRFPAAHLLFALLAAGSTTLIPAPFAYAQEVEQENHPGLAAKIEEILNRDGARKALWGIEVYSPSRGRTLYSLNGERYFTPASVTKLFTTAAALDLLGADYRFRTTVETHGAVDEDGKLVGDIILVGRGDPDLAGCALPWQPPREEEAPGESEEDAEVCPFSQHLDRLAAQVSARGVKLVTGSLIADTSFFSPEPYADGWGYYDLLWSYGAPIRALSIADNVIAFKVEPGPAVGRKAKITWQPPTHFYRVENLTWTAPPGSRTQLYVRRDPGTFVVEISGPIALNRRPRTLAVAIEEPAEVAAELFRASLLRAGVRVQGSIQVRYGLMPPMPSPSAEDPGEVLAEHLSRPLGDGVRFVLKESQNLHAEILLRLLGRSRPPETEEELPAPLRSRFAPPPRFADGSTEAGLHVLRAWSANAGLEAFDVGLRDGSGLSREALVTPRAVTSLLRAAASRPWAEFYFDSLPVAGVDGTLEKRMRGTPAEGRVRAKTGTLSGNTALAGEVETLAGERLFFAVFLGHHRLSSSRATGLIDDIMVALAELSR